MQLEGPRLHRQQQAAHRRHFIARRRRQGQQVINKGLYVMINIKRNY